MYCVLREIGIMEFYIAFQTGSFSSEASQHWQLTQWLAQSGRCICADYGTPHWKSWLRAAANPVGEETRLPPPRHNTVRQEKGNLGTDWAAQAGKSQARSVFPAFHREGPVPGRVFNQEAPPAENGANKATTSVDMYNSSLLCTPETQTTVLIG